MFTIHPDCIGTGPKAVRYFRGYFLILIASALSAQVVYWEPEHPVQGGSVSIYYDVIAGTLPDNTNQVSIHLGYNNWQDVVDEPMTYTGRGGWWRFDWHIPEHVTVIDFVFQDGQGNWDNNGGVGVDWHIPVYELGLTAIIIEPEVDLSFGEPRRSPVFTNIDDTVRVMASAVAEGTQTTFLELQVAGRVVARDSSDTLVYDFVAENYGVGSWDISVLVQDTSGITDETVFVIMVNPLIVDRPPPSGVLPGINYGDPTTVTLALFAPFKKFVYVLGDFNDWYIDTTYYMYRYQPEADSTLWWLTISGLSPGTEYAFQYLVDGNLRIADPYTDKILDPWNDPGIEAETYPDLKPYPEELTREIVSVLQTAQQPFTWVYSDTFRRPDQKELVIYELLVRDFIKRHDYQTLIDTLDYLERLGINAIELMPINEFEGNSSWGYNPSFYFAPDKYYGTKHALKLFIDECHRRGIAVIMDIVLNHTYGQSPLVRLYWDSANNRPSVENPWYNPVSPNPVFAW
ncbi:MAG: alpha-amylase, partial [FCB group bacterium]|nr:alpha-amylase [FCB group bacterium]